MLAKIFNFFFPLQKTMIQLAKEKILEQTHVVNNSDEIDFTNDKFFVIGSIIPNKMSKRFNGFNVLFNNDDSTVAIKDGDIVLYYFNRPHEVQEIRSAIKELGTR